MSIKIILIIKYIIVSIVQGIGEAMTSFVPSIGKTLVDARHELKEYTIPDGVERIGCFAFCCNEIETINIPDTVKIIGAYSFANSNIVWCNLNQFIIFYKVERLFQTHN